MLAKERTEQAVSNVLVEKPAQDKKAEGTSSLKRRKEVGLRQQLDADL